LLGIVAATAGLLLMIGSVVLTGATGSLLQETQRLGEHAEAWWRSVAGRAQLSSAIGLTRGARSQWELYNRGHVIGSYSVGRRTSFVRTCARLTRAAAQVALYAIGAWLVIRGELAPGALVAAGILLARALAPLEQMVTSLRSAVVAARAYACLKSHVSDVKQLAVGCEATSPRGEVALAGVTCFHPSRRLPSVRDVSVTISPASALAIVGPNGSGKSTLAAVIAGAMEPHSGSASLDGVPIVHWQRSGGRVPIGYLPDDPTLFEGSVHENIARFCEASRLAVARAAMRAGVHDTIASLPQGYDTPIGPSGEGLSLRERRVVAFARALFGDPVLLVLDEPELGLDAGGVHELARVLERLKADGMGMVLATQDQRLLRLADQTIVLGGGTVQLQGATNAVLGRIQHMSRGLAVAGATG
jgi:ABC-type protease/lipase transport system fused ATPase/permease subunit